MSLLITGGTGFIGSHTVIELLALDKDIVIVDNLSNSSTLVLDRIKQITDKSVTFIQADICDRQALKQVFEQHDIEAVVHFAGLKAVGESSVLPLSYYHNNVSGSVTLLQVMAEHNVKNLVFSSSATVYGENNPSPLDETMPTSATNPYGQTKLMIENILFDLARSDEQWSIACLRYFNPIGAHESGLIGENPNGIPNNLLPYVSQVAVGRLAQLQVFGDDYQTPDGTGVRDYIHVVDLAQGHVKALAALSDIKGCVPINLGTGNGTSVLEIVNTFQEISGQDIPYNIAPRRAGDIGTVYADASVAKTLLDWHAKLDLATMITDTWRWQSKNPNGFE
ncbi:UDP-glucose 4-epimerase GalE [Colwellia sp. MB02u-18]|uniref:UDP-glucose 4-epimerase GalE n=1 Tax=unclassified Colwellia TaxID=196834 RepID=UPI0015F6DD17|nr:MULTISPECIES: UDP-glucose 4-epimerase GalE [unclassified Colwellia]MBA6224510.1 UDP-glucose 4-epimerase GalE [Colwellia sp. MB3u-45]MBA6267620.1 UDP-glucose 4-epimerase GalE [Colwellia sp. MB3u-43]MBA6322204.1 UDP-glucose 4-epimerase GalE [Colwellia sp. MB02u-19]MBA6326208.1 UDP-glucose 4-epimerase GalE [Colwellia sp. MB02u-18]MBA6331667.1 UDP-glucose 4-epimerase GalE [Colwellia sp. MB02u-12]